jgi:hypothetical protein
MSLKIGTLFLVPNLPLFATRTGLPRLGRTSSKRRTDATRSSRARLRRKPQHGTHRGCRLHLEIACIDGCDLQPTGVIGLYRVGDLYQFFLGGFRRCERAVGLEFQLGCMVAMPMGRDASRL